MAFNGSYILDSAKSEDTDPLLTAQGVGWLKRKAMNNLSQTITIAIDGDNLKITQETSLKTTEAAFTLGADFADFTEELSGETAKRKAYLEGDKLIQIIQSSNGLMTVTRTLEADGKVLHAVISFKPTSGAEVTCNRFFNRK